MTFSGDLQKFAQKTGTRMDLVVRKVCLDLTRDIVKATPVRDGFAKSGYFFGFDRNPSAEATPSKNGSPSIQRAGEFSQGLKAGTVFYITNNLPYIMRLEFGSSSQAPAGMARIAVARWQARVNQIVAAVSR